MSEIELTDLTVNEDPGPAPTPAPKVKIRLQPTFDRVLIERIPESETNEGGKIIIPEVSQTKPNQGYVRDVGPQVMTDDKKAMLESAGQLGDFLQTFNIGDKVMIGQYAGTEMVVDGTTFLLVKQDEIMNKIVEVPVTE